jgi:phage anti-repressor protein
MSNNENNEELNAKEEAIEELGELLGIDQRDASLIYADANDPNKQGKSLEEFDVVDGKYRDDKQKQIAQAKELEELLGIHSMNPYKTLCKEIFAENIESMSVSEMTALAMEVGVPPQQNSTQLKKQLIDSFEMYARRHNVNVPSQAKPIIDENSPNYKKTVRLFKDI